MDIGYKCVGVISIYIDVLKFDKMEEWVYKRWEDVLEIGDIICLFVSEMKKLFLVLVDGYELVYISGVVCVNGRVLCWLFLSVVEKCGVKIIKGNVFLFFENEMVIGV